MRRSILVGFALAAILAVPRPAAAWDFWDWMQEWSGPGPFHTGGNALATFCFGNFGEGSKKTPCAYFDARQFVTDANDNFPIAITANAYDFGASWRLRHSVEVGVGAGVISAMGARRTSKFTVTPARFVIKPLVILSDLMNRQPVILDKQGPKKIPARILHSLKVYYRVSIMLGDLEAEDLGVSATLSSFSESNEAVQSAGFLIDLGELFGRYR